MKIKLTFLILLTIFSGSLLSVVAQSTGDPEAIEKQVVALESRNVDDFAASVRQIYKENLLFLYQSYLTALQRQIDLLESIPDPRGDFGRKRAEYERKREDTKTKIAIVEGNLRITASDPGSGGVSDREPQIRSSPPRMDGVEKKESTPAANNTAVPPAAAPPPVRRSAAQATPVANQDCTQSIVVGVIDSSTNSYTAASRVMQDEADIAAREIIEQLDMGANADEGPLAAAIRHYSTIYHQTVARSIESESDTESAIVNLQPLRYLPETYRTDKQIGASSATSAATSAVDKPGFAYLLGLAIENGYVEKDVQDTVLTLSTSPAAFLALRERNFATAYQKAGFLNRIGLSAAFNINSDNPLLSNVNRSQLRDYSVRFRFLGDHSANSERLQSIWDETIAPQIRSQLVAVGQIREFVDENSVLRELRNCTQRAFVTAFNAKLESQQFKSLSADKRRTDLVNFYLNFMKAAVADRFVTGQTVLDASVKSELRQRMFTLLEVQKNFAYKTIKKELDDFFKRPIGTIAYINHRDPLGNYSEIKVLYQQTDSFLKPLTLTANAGYSFYHKPNAALNQKKTRDFNFALAFEGKTDSPFAEDGDFSQITYTFTGRYVRFLENQNMANRKPDLLSAQFLLNLPIFKGFIMPFSVTYSNATELERKAGVRVNFGLKLDAEKLFALTRQNVFF